MTKVQVVVLCLGKVHSIGVHIWGTIYVDVLINNKYRICRKQGALRDDLF